MCDELIKIQKKLIELTEKCYEIGLTGKLGEPHLRIWIDNNMKVGAEIFSYMLNLSDSGRHHYFEADNLNELFQKIWKAIERAEEYLKIESREVKS